MQRFFPLSSSEGTVGPRSGIRDSALLVFIALGMSIEFDLIGRLTLADVLCAALLPFLWVSRWRSLASDRRYAMILILAVFWFAGAAVTDIVRATPSDDLARGWAKIVFFMIDFVAVSCLIRNRIEKAILFVLFVAISSVIKIALGVGGVEFGDEVFGTAWKFGYGMLFAEICFLVAVYFNKRGMPKTSYLLPFFSGALSLILNARNLFAVTILSLIIGIFRRPGTKLSRENLIIYIILGLLSLYGVMGIYKYAASSGALGFEAQAKYELQATSNLGLIAGRSEVLASTMAIKDSPIIGHGSWARDMRYRDFMVEKLGDAGVLIQGDPYGTDLIPTHSHLFGAWVEAGLAGGIFWGYILVLSVMALLKITQSPIDLTPFVALICLQFAWDIFFSPFGLDRRVMDAGWITLIVIVLRANPNGSAVIIDQGRRAQPVSV